MIETILVLGFMFKTLVFLPIFLIVALVARSVIRKRKHRKSLHQRADGTWVWTETNGRTHSSPTCPTDPGGAWCSGGGFGGGDFGGGDGGGGGGD